VNLKKKIESLANEKGIVKATKVAEVKSEKHRESEERVRELELKLKNLEMLLKYKSSQSEGSSSFQLLVNKLT
jgi:hypothetical protein